MVVDAASGKTVLANKTVNQILQEPSAASVKAYSDWITMRPSREPVNDADRPLERALRGETVIGEEYIVARRDGSETWVRASAAPIREESGEIAAGLVVFIGIDDQKKAQEALLQSEKLAAAGRLAASISHEINNPLESVTNLLFIALSDETISPDTRTMLRQADQELARVAHIATQTLRFYRQSTNPKSVDMGDLVDSVLQLLTTKIRNTNVRIETKYRAGQQITCFEGEMRQVFTNLICNALDAAPAKGGRLEIRTKRVCASTLGRDGIQVTVADNGHGISSAFARRIFEPFYTTKGSLGTGLGLWVTQEIVGKHNGSIRVRSKPDCGTVFAVFIPFKDAAESKQVAA
jgi:PAS domain S-box-containing protein